MRLILPHQPKQPCATLVRLIHLRENSCLQQIAANRFSIPQDVIAILLQGFVLRSPELPQINILQVQQFQAIYECNRIIRVAKADFQGQSWVLIGERPNACQNVSRLVVFIPKKGDHYPPTAHGYEMPQ
jgi:hypothetical protein